MKKTQLITVDNTVDTMIATLEALREKSHASESKIDTPSDQHRWMTIAETETYCGILRHTLRRAVKAQYIQCSKLGKSTSSKVLIERASVDAWLERCRWKPST